MEWDEAVDVVCIGSGAGAMAAAIVSADAGQSVFVAASSVVRAASGRVDVAIPDAEAAEYFSAVTENLPAPTGAPSDRGLPIRIVADATAPGSCRPRHAVVEPFVGARLRRWDSGCLSSPGGVLYSRVTERNMATVRSADGDQVEVAVVGSLPLGCGSHASAVAGWLAEQARDRGIDVHTGPIDRLVFDDGDLVGVVVGTPAGARAIHARCGVVVAVGEEHATAGAREPAGQRRQPVGIVSKTASRFGRLELLTDGPCPQPHVSAPASLSRQLHSHRRAHTFGSVKPPNARPSGRDGT